MEIDKEITKFSKSVIGVMQINKRFHLVTKINNDNTVSAVWISTFGISTFTKHLPINSGKLVLFSKNRVLYDMIKQNKYQDFLERNFNIK